MQEQTNGNPADIFQRWLAVNREFLDASVKACTAIGKDPTHLNDAYREELRGARDAVSRTLELEREAVDAIEQQALSALPANGLSELPTSMARAGIDLRQRLWDAWFAQAEQLGATLPDDLVQGLAPLPPQEAAPQPGDEASSRRPGGPTTSAAGGGKGKPRQRAAAGAGQS